jgi:two-component system, OmpR family, phosphate regulon sensor histidine kinase PhoR
MTLSAPDFELLLQANRILSSKLNVEDVLQAVLELATKVVKAEAASLLLLDEKTNELYFDVALGEVSDRVKQIRIKVGEGIAGWVAEKMAPLIVNDVRKDPRFTARVDKSTSFVTRSILAVPLKSKGKLIGVVEAINRENGQDFTQEDKEAFGVFASQAGIAIENARLFSAVSAEKKKLDTVFSEMSDGVLVLDDAGKIEIVNAAAGRILGSSSEQIVGRHFDAHLFPDLQASPPINNLKSFKGDSDQIELVRREGKDFILLATLHKIKTSDSERGGWIVILHDVTEERRGELLKRDFLSLISHKLKTPLTVIVGYAPALQSKSDGLSDFQKKAIAAICTQGDQLSELVEKLLQFTIVESADLKRKTEPKVVKDLLDEARVDLKQWVDQKSAIIRLEGVDSKLPKVNVDANLTVAVFKNVIENGFKFNESAVKEVAVEAQKVGKGVEIKFRDNGIGIPPEETEKVFQKFYQIENSFTGQVPGAGLGLALCKKVVEAMGGQISIQSHLKQGTTVTIVLPTR